MPTFRFKLVKAELRKDVGYERQSPDSDCGKMVWRESYALDFDPVYDASENEPFRDGGIDLVGVRPGSFGPIEVGREYLLEFKPVEPVAVEKP